MDIHLHYFKSLYISHSAQVCFMILQKIDKPVNYIEKFSFRILQGHYLTLDPIYAIEKGF